MLQNLGLNALDLLIIGTIGFYLIEGFEAGFVESFLDLLNFVASFIAGLKFYSFFGNLLVYFFATPPGFAHAFGFFIAAFLCEVILTIFLHDPFRKLYRFFVAEKNQSGSIAAAYLTTLNKFLGLVPGFVSSLILLSFLFTTIISLPVSSRLKEEVSNSKLANNLIISTQDIEKNLNGVFGGAVSETLNFLTIKPQGNESVDLGFKTKDVSIDRDSEEKMVEMVNKERESEGLEALVADPQLTELARNHSKDMFARGYFSHYTPDNISPFDRMGLFHISFTYAGENLALAPNVSLAMQGLMKSEGHRKNILSVDFGKIGVGVIDGGIYGKMFTQEFTD